MNRSYHFKWGTDLNCKIFGEGSLHAKVFLLGDNQEQDFLTRESKELLTKILKSIEIDLQTVFISNVLQFSSSKNQLDEIAENILDQQLTIIQPAIICTWGIASFQALLNTQDSIADFHGNILKYFLKSSAQVVPVLATYHPVDLFKDESLKRIVWNDMKKLRDFLASHSNKFSK